MSSQSVLIIDCYLETPGATSNFSRFIHGKAWDSFLPAHEKIPNDELTSYSGIIITGSAASVLDKRPWVERLVPEIQKALKANIPILGVCFGHQLLAYALGGVVQKAPALELGTVSIYVDQATPLLAGLPGSFECFVSHEDEVVSLGPECEIMAHSEQCRIQGFTHQKYPAWGIQFHPEMPPSEAHSIIKWRAERHPEHNLHVEQIHAGRVEQAELAEHIFSRFIHRCFGGTCLNLNSE